MVSAESLRSANSQEHYCLQPVPRAGSMKVSACRMEAEEQGSPLEAAIGIPEEGFDQLGIDLEAEYQSPDDDAELSLEDAQAAGATPGAVRVTRRASLAVPLTMWDRSLLPVLPGLTTVRLQKHHLQMTGSGLKHRTRRADSCGGASTGHVS